MIGDFYTLWAEGNPPMPTMALMERSRYYADMETATCTARHYLRESAHNCVAVLFVQTDATMFVWKRDELLSNPPSRRDDWTDGTDTGPSRYPTVTDH